MMITKAVLTQGPCWVILALVVMALVTSCAIDTSKIERTRADLLVLCEKPLTVPLQKFCERALPDLPGPVNLAPGS